MSVTYRTQRKVRFQHCDPAAIVFFPRYFEMINSVVEDWFEDVVGASFNQLHMERRNGVPTARINTDFTAPSRLGDRLDFELTVDAVGGASLTITITATCAGELRLRSTSTLVYVDMNTGKPMPWPEDFRQRFDPEHNTGKPA